MWTQDPNPGLPYLNQPSITQIQASPHVVREIQALTAGFSIFSPKQPSPLMHPLIAQTQDPNPRLPHLKQPPMIQIWHFLHVIHENRAPMARFQVFGPNPLPEPRTSNRMATPPSPPQHHPTTPH